MSQEPSGCNICKYIFLKKAPIICTCRIFFVPLQLIGINNAKKYYSSQKTNDLCLKNLNVLSTENTDMRALLTQLFEQISSSDNTIIIISSSSSSTPRPTSAYYVPFPGENDYVALLAWLEDQKAKGIDYYAAANMNRSKMCRQLSNILGWTVDQNSLRKAQQR